MSLHVTPAVHVTYGDAEPHEGRSFSFSFKVVRPASKHSRVRELEQPKFDA
jgi:hypothetical protein